MNAKDELRRLCAEGGSHARIKYLRNKMKRATIAELRKLLRERGVRFNEFKLMTQWVGALGESVEAYTTDTFPDTLLVKHAYLTPEQATAATLGRGTCHMRETTLSFVSDGNNDGYYMICSECGFAIYMRRIWAPLKYCSNCGRKVVDE